MNGKCQQLTNVALTHGVGLSWVVRFIQVEASARGHQVMRHSNAPAHVRVLWT